MKNSKIRRQRRKTYRLSQVHAVVMGVGAAGRQVAILLASLGVGYLSLYDPRIVTEKDMAEGFLDYDVGTPAVDAVANVAHQYHPQMELLTYHARFRRSHLTQWKAGLKHAIFLCSEDEAASEMHWQWVRHSAEFLCEGSTQADMVRVVCSDRPVEGLRHPTISRDSPPYDGRTPDVVTSTLTASLMVTQFTRWLRRLPLVPVVQIDLSSWELTVQ